MSTFVRDLGRGVYLVESPEHTSGVVLTRDDAVVIDPGAESGTGGRIFELLDELDTRAGYVLSTRSGVSRSPGAELFPEALLLYPTPGPAPREQGPVAGFSRDAFLRLGGVGIELLRVDAKGDGVVVRIPTRDVLFAGALSRVAAGEGDGVVWTHAPERLRGQHRVHRLAPAAGAVWAGEGSAVLDGVPLMRAAAGGALRVGK